MNFIDKLNYLMNKNGLNKSTLSKACGIPYTTIDGWYKKGFDDLRLSTLKKLASFFNTSLDFWAYDETDQKIKISKEKQEFISSISQLDDTQLKLLNDIVDSIKRNSHSEDE